MIYPRLIIPFICFFILAFQPHVMAKTKNLSALFKNSMEVAKTIPYDGVVFVRFKTQKGEVTSKIKTYRHSSGVQRMEIIEPSALKNHIIARINNDTWMTPVSHEDIMNLPEDIRYYHWFLISRDITAAIKQDELDLFLKNYKLTGEDCGKVANRKVQTIYVSGRNRYRPSLRIWIDFETKMPLKYEMYDNEKHITKSVEFRKINFIKNSDKEEITTDGLEKLSPPKHKNEKDVVKLDFTPLCLDKIPKGFKEQPSHSWMYKEEIIYETPYRDGFANFTIYQRKQSKEEREKQLKEPKEERYKAKKIIFHGRNLYYRELDGVRVSVIGSGVSSRGLRFVLYHMNSNESKEKPQKKPSKDK